MLRRRVLRFIKDDEGVVEGSASHIGKRRDFDGASLHVALHFFRRKHVVQGVVEWSKIGGQFFVEVTWKKSQCFACLNGWTGENDPCDGVCFEKGKKCGKGLLVFG